MNHGELAEAVSRALDGRRLIWFGTRGDDMESLSTLEELDQVFSIISADLRRASVPGRALEDDPELRTRFDLDTYELDDHLRSEPVRRLRDDLLKAMGQHSAIATYRPSTFVSSAHFARIDRCRYLGLFKDHQAAFEHKPWLESEVGRLGLDRIEWKYISDNDQFIAEKAIQQRPQVLRRSRTTGGVGLVRVDDVDALPSSWFDEESAFVSMAPFLEGGYPVNVSGVVWAGGVTVHPASLQLIGIESCTTRPFGYCGNDFGAIDQLPERLLHEIDRSTREIGAWMGGRGYRGAFGVDFLVHDGRALFTEVNPRFQGSTHASCRLAVEIDESDLLLEHLASFLDLPAPDPVALVDWAERVPALANVVVHHVAGDAAPVDPAGLIDRLEASPGAVRVDVRTRPDLVTEAGATVCRLTTRQRVTETGFELLPTIEAAVTGADRTAVAP